MQNTSLLSIKSSDANDLGSRHQALSHPYVLSRHPILDRQEQRESNARSYPRRIPIALKRARGIYVEDVEGRVFIDCLAGAGTLALGHNHPVIVQAIEKILKDELPLHTLDLTTPVKDQFVQDLFDILPSEFSKNAKIQFCGPTGTDAVEAALKLVRIAKGRNNILAFHGAYHGMTQGALHLMGNLGPKRGLGGPLQGVQFLPYPYDYRCPFGLGGQAGERAGIQYINTILSDPESGIPQAAALIIEAIQGEGGVIPAPDSWMKNLRRLTAQFDVPLILDEIQTGFARTGKMFAFEHSEIIPDVIVLSKAIGGSLPLSVVVYKEELDQWKSGSHAGTFRGNQMAMAAGSATIQFIRSERLDLHAQAMGSRLISHLKQLQENYRNIGDVRGRGLMIGVEIVEANGELDVSGQPASAPKLASAIQAECLKRGLIIELGGRHGSVIRFLPPLIISEKQLDHVAEIFAAALRAAVRSTLPVSH